MARSGQAVAGTTSASTGHAASLGKVEEGHLICPYHGWRYDGNGRCTHIPAHPEQKPPEKAAARVYQVRERYGLIWVSLGQPDRDVPPFPEHDDPAYRTVLCGPSEVLNAARPASSRTFSTWRTGATCTAASWGSAVSGDI